MAQIPRHTTTAVGESKRNKSTKKDSEQRAAVFQARWRTNRLLRTLKRKDGRKEERRKGREGGRGGDLQRLTKPANGFGSRAKENHRPPREDSSSFLCLVIQSVFTSAASRPQKADPPTPRSCPIHHSSVPKRRQEVPTEQKNHCQDCKVGPGAVWCGHGQRSRGPTSVGEQQRLVAKPSKR